MVKYFHFHNTLTGKKYDRALGHDECTLNRINGMKCRKRCQIGMSICWIHLLSECNLRIKTSVIPNCGMGLFALRKKVIDDSPIFTKNQKICNYGSQIINETDLQGRYGNRTAPYALSISNDRYEDGAVERGIGSLINHNPRKANCKFVIGNNSKGYIRATKKIFHNEELYLNYRPRGTRKKGRYEFNEPGVITSTNYKRFTA